MLKTIKKASKTITILIIIIYILFSSLITSFASNIDYKVPLTAERAGNYVANFAINFVTNFGKKVEYSNENLEILYNGGKINEKYVMNNKSFIAFVYNQSLKLEQNGNFPSLDCLNYITAHTKSENATYNDKLFEQIFFNNIYIKKSEEGEEIQEPITEYLNLADLATNDEIKPGDILIKTKNSDSEEDYEGKMFLYIGAGQVIYAQSTEDGKNALIRNYTDNMDCSIDTVYRIKEEAANLIEDTNATMLFEGKGYDSKITYQGIPSRGAYLGTTTLLDKIYWLVDCLANILDYLIGILLSGIRMILIGWGNLVENLVNYILLGSKEEENGVYVNSITGKANNLGKRISVEDIIYNRVPILDVNFFNTTIAGGSEIADNSIVAIIRTNIASWYYLIRTTSIVLMIFILIYVGIRIAIASTGEKKSQFKSALAGWLIGFISVIAIHFFIYIMFKMNEYLVTLFEEVALKMNGGEESLYETIRTKSYSFKFTEGFGATILYLFLLFVLIKFSIIYFKRYVTVTVLGMLGPIMGLKYAIERATGRKTKSISAWMFEFAMNILIQSMHALIYIAIMSLALSVAFESLAGFVIALVILNFMLQADKLFMKIFNFDRSKSVGDTVQQEGVLQQFAKFTLGISLTKKMAKGVFGAGALTVRRGVNFIERTGDIIHDREAGETRKDYQRKIYKVGGFAGRGLNKITHNKISTLAALSLLKGTKDSKKMDEEAVKALKLNMSLKKKSFKRALKSISSSVGGLYKIATGIPLTVAEPMAGAALIVNGVSGINNVSDKTAIENMRQVKKYDKWINDQLDIGNGKGGSVKVGNALRKTKGTVDIPARAVGTAAMMGIGGVMTSLHYDINDYDEQRYKNHLLIEKLQEAEGKQEKLGKEYEELKAEIKRLNPGTSEEKLEELTKKEFSKTVKEASTKRVKSSTIKKAIQEYVEKIGENQLTVYDAEEIMKIVKQQEAESGKVLVFEDGALENIRDSLSDIVDSRKTRYKTNNTTKAEMQKAFKQGLAKNGSIKSDTVKKDSPTKLDEIKLEISQDVREYENIRESNKSHIEGLSTVVSRIKNQDKENKS